MTQRETTGHTTPAGGTTDWNAWHLHLGTTARSAHDRVLTEVVGPVVRELGPDRPWFFMRYWQSGPHIRLRVGDLDPRTYDRVERSLTERLAVAGRLTGGEEPLDADAYRLGAGRLAAAGETGDNRFVRELREPGVHRAVYEPETERYGGASLMPATERLFRLASELVLGCVPRISTDGHRAMLALRGTMAAAGALGGPEERSYYYAHGLGAWRAWATEAGHPDDLLDRIITVNRDGSAKDAAPADHGPFAGWHSALVSLKDLIEEKSPTHPGMILFSHAHMLHNRLGLSLLDELRTYAWLAHVFPLPEGAHGLGELTRTA
ncbi:thiopeptide-type bacteriocin biosynthesis protein [Streptomyces sp. NPDC051098]|uniref:thiopeptide-type bacteriocin biosynthesis protein n=1 Tax=Streptomyces sp. NPDC051098 TaxID=3155411 RepID=UPI00341E16F1